MCTHCGCTGRAAADDQHVEYVFLAQCFGLAREVKRGDAKIGTTGKGIGPAYEDKVARRAG